LQVIVARAKLVEGFRSIIDNDRGHSIIVDLPKERGGTNTGATALELAIMALAGCITTVYSLIAKKMRAEIEDLNVIVKAERPDGEATITKVEIEVKVKSRAPREMLSKMLNLTLKNCPVGALFEKAGVKIEAIMKVEG